MKQHITIEQLDKLSEEGEKRFLDWYSKFIEQQFGKSQKDILKTFNIGRLELPLLSIGQMIEFLGDNGWYHIETIDKPIFHWDVAIDPAKNNGFAGALHEELCDALWEVVKEVLEQ